MEPRKTAAGSLAHLPPPQTGPCPSSLFHGDRANTTSLPKAESDKAPPLIPHEVLREDCVPAQWNDLKTIRMGRPLRRLCWNRLVRFQFTLLFPRLEGCEGRSLLTFTSQFTSFLTKAQGPFSRQGRQAGPKVSAVTNRADVINCHVCSPPHPPWGSQSWSQLHCLPGVLPGEGHFPGGWGGGVRGRGGGGVGFLGQKGEKNHFILILLLLRVAGYWCHFC